MSLAHRYTDFGTQSQINADPRGASEPLEDVKLQAFENGYRAGWDDAVQAHEAENGKVALDLAQNFQDMSFTFHEAHTQLTCAIKPLLEQMVGKLLPEIAAASLSGHVLEQLENLLAEQLTGAVEIAVAPENKSAIEIILEDQAEIPFALVAEPALSPGQVYVRAGNAEREINLDAVIEGVSEALTAFFHQTEKEKSNG